MALYGTQQLPKKLKLEDLEAPDSGYMDHRRRLIFDLLGQLGDRLQKTSMAITGDTELEVNIHALGEDDTSEGADATYDQETNEVKLTGATFRLDGRDHLRLAEYKGRVYRTLSENQYTTYDTVATQADDMFDKLFADMEDGSVPMDLERAVNIWRSYYYFAEVLERGRTITEMAHELPGTLKYLKYDATLDLESDKLPPELKELLHYAVFGKFMGKDGEEIWGDGEDELKAAGECGNSEDLWQHMAKAMELCDYPFMRFDASDDSMSSGSGRPNRGRSNSRTSSEMQSMKDAVEDAAKGEMDRLIKGALGEQIEMDIDEDDEQYLKFDWEYDMAESLAESIKKLTIEDARKKFLPVRKFGQIDGRRLSGIVSGDSFMKRRERGGDHRFSCAVGIDLSGSTMSSWGRSAGDGDLATIEAGVARAISYACQQTGLDFQAVPYSSGAARCRTVPLDASDMECFGGGTDTVAAMNEAAEWFEEEAKFKKRLYIHLTDGEAGNPTDALSSAGTRLKEAGVDTVVVHLNMNGHEGIMANARAMSGNDGMYVSQQEFADAMEHVLEDFAYGEDLKESISEYN